MFAFISNIFTCFANKLFVMAVKRVKMGPRISNTEGGGWTFVPQKIRNSAPKKKYEKNWKSADRYLRRIWWRPLRTDGWCLLFKSSKKLWKLNKMHWEHKSQVMRSARRVRQFIPKFTAQKNGRKFFFPPKIRRKRGGYEGHREWNDESSHRSPPPTPQISIYLSKYVHFFFQHHKFVKKSSYVNI